MTELFNQSAGEYILNSVKLYKLDEPEKFIEISNLIHNWTLTESMDSAYVFGSAKIYDAVSLLDEFLGEEQGWLKGEEEIEFEYTDFFNTRLKQKFFVYSITDLISAKRGNETIYEYTMHFVSKEKFYSNRETLRRGFNGGKISDYVQEIFDDYFQSEKELIVEETDGLQNLIIPYYKPDEAMYFFARKAYSAENPTQTFRFFENREAFYFTTHENLVKELHKDTQRLKDVIKFTKNELSDQTPDGQVGLMSTIIDISYPTHVNTFKDMNEGGYYTSTRELDFLNRTALLTEYRYLDEYQNYTNIDNDNKLKSKHSKKFVDEHLYTTRDVLVLKDYADKAVNPFLRKNTRYPNLYNEKNVNLYHFDNESIQIRIYGRNTIKAGDFINLDLSDVNYAVEDRKLDSKRSGLYLVESIENVFLETRYTQLLKISKSGYHEKPEASGDYNRNPQTENEGAGTPDGTRQPTPAGINRGPEVGSKSKAELEALALEAGFSQEDARIMAAVALAESSGNPSALNNNASTGDLSYGLWQINMIGAIGPERKSQLGLNTYDELYNPSINASAAKSVFDSQGFNAWSVYRSGAYRDFL